MAVLVEKFYEDLELWYPVLRLREAGLRASRSSAPKTGDTHASKHGYPAKADVAASEVKASDFYAVIIPGGYSPDHMRRHPAMVDLVTQAARLGKVLAAICHGPWMLCSAKCLKGKKVTGFFAIRDDVENAGGVWEDAAVVRDGNTVTSRTPDDLAGFHAGCRRRSRSACASGLTNDAASECLGFRNRQPNLLGADQPLAGQMKSLIRFSSISCRPLEFLAASPLGRM